MRRFDESAKERLSALLDGELDGGDPADACAAWSADGEARRHWHTWHLIGDVLRSEDLASDPKRDATLCDAIRVRLQQEPVVLARSAPLVGAAPRRSRWAIGGAMAAGVVLVAGTFAVLRSGDALAPSPALAQSEAPAVATVATAGGAVPGIDANAANEPVVANVRVIHDAELERYLTAHKQFSGSSALGVPSAFLRSATVDTAAR